MKKIIELGVIGCFFILCFCVISKAQIIVPNSGFETYTTCPGTANRLLYATPWFNPASGSPDYFNQCGNGIVDIPDNVYGFQPAYNGNAYVGIYCYSDAYPNTREYVCAKLARPLQPGTEYTVEFYVSLATYCNFAIETIGAYLSADTSFTMAGYFISNASPQIVNTSGVLTDTINWMLVSDTFTATGEEQYITIGNFYDDTSCGLMFTNGNQYPTNRAYYYIDDVSVTPNLTTSAVEQNNKTHMTIYPNPASGVVTIQSQQPGKLNYTIYDARQRLLESGSLLQNKTIDIGGFETGIYLIMIETDQGVVSKKIVKQN